MQNSPSMSVPAERNLIRRASGLLSNIAIPFANHRASFLLDSDTASNAMEGQEGLDAQMSGWSTRGKRQKSTTSASQVLVETFREVHTSSAQNSPRKDIRVITSQSALMANQKSIASAQSLLKPHSYHYKRTSSCASSQGYSVASQRLSSSSRSMEQLIMAEDIKEILGSSDFQAACNGAQNLSPILDEPNSPESDADETFLFSPRQRSKSLQPYAASAPMERGIETTSSYGYTLELPHEQKQSPYWKAPEEKRLSKEDYSSWIRFENPIDLLSPAGSSTMTSPSVFSPQSFENPTEQQEQRALESYSMTREETQSYLGDSPIEKPFSMYTHSDLGTSSQNFGALSSSGLFVPQSSHYPISPSLKVPKAEDQHRSLRKKISQTFKETFGKPAQSIKRIVVT
ncbi:hypothetical protein KEM48_012036 [Puccinia striiformis f. sp. tritici PST-130]|nr:hypothetical protein KEM48_012036 [Puccinia striiformis f. sp. tritici PST-130]